MVWQTLVVAEASPTEGMLVETTVNEIADGIYRLSTWVPEVAPPAGFVNAGPKQPRPLVENSHT